MPNPFHTVADALEHLNKVLLMHSIVPHGMGEHINKIRGIADSLGDTDEHLMRREYDAETEITGRAGFETCRFCPQPEECARNRHCAAEPQHGEVVTAGEPQHPTVVGEPAVAAAPRPADEPPAAPMAQSDEGVPVK